MRLRCKHVSKMAKVSTEVAVITDENKEQISFSFWNLASGLQEKNYKGSVCGAHCITSVGKEYVFTAQDKKQLIYVWDLKKVEMV